MASDNEEDDRSVKKSNSVESVANFCNYCNKKVVDALCCVKCNATLHKSCWNSSKTKKSATCNHVEKLEIKDFEEPVSSHDYKAENEFLRMQVKLLTALVEEVKSKNQILMMNNELLLEKIKVKSDKSNDNVCKQSDTKKRTNEKTEIQAPLTAEAEISRQNSATHSVSMS